MGILAIANIIDGKNTIGLRLLDTISGQIKDVPIANVIGVLASGKATIDNVGLENGKLVGTNGSLDRLPEIMNGVLVGIYSPVIIVNQIDDIGYTVTSYKGTMVKLKNEDVLKYAKLNGIANGKIVNRDGKEFISSINGEYPKISSTKLAEQTPADNKVVENNKDRMETVKEQLTTPKASEEQMGRLKNVVKEVFEQAKEASEEIEDTNKSGDTSNKKDKEKDSDIKTTKNIKPSNLAKEIDCGNGVTAEQKIVRAMYNMKFTHPFYFAIYSLLKRIETVDINTMAVATRELYYNPYFVAKMSEEELNFINLHEVAHIAMMHSFRRKHRDSYIFNIACDLYVNKVICEEFNLEPGQTVVIEKVRIKCPTDLCYHPDIDVMKDTPEIIYDAIMKELEEELKSGNSMSNAGAQMGGSKGSSSKSTGSSSSGESGDADDQSTDNAEDKQGKKVVYKGKVFSIPESQRDIIETDKTGSEKVMDEVATRQMLEQARIRIHGKTASLLDRLVAEMLAPKLDWRKLLRNKLIEITQTITTFAKPDRRFISRNMTLPGPKQLEPDKLKGAKICIDTSASISDEDLGVFFHQIRDLLNTYKVEAEVIYWDTEITTRADFKSIKEFEKVKAKGGGGTDPTSLFEYFESKACKHKPSVILIFTDGYFEPIDKKYHRKYHKDTIWIVINNRGFKPEFGKVAPFKIEI